MDHLWNLLPQKKIVSSCRGGFKKSAETHETATFRYVFFYEISSKTYLSTYLSIHTYTYSCYIFLKKTIALFPSIVFHCIPQHIGGSIGQISVQDHSRHSCYNIPPRISPTKKLTFMLIRVLSFPVVLKFWN